MLYLSTIILSVFITVSLIPVMMKLAGRFHLVDVPDMRKVHSSPIPRIGGLAIAVGASIPVILWTPADDFVKSFLIGAGTIVLFGFIDDVKGLGHKTKFIGQVFAATLMVLFGGIRITTLGSLLPGGVVLPEWFVLSLSMVAIVGVTNAINLADGLDGLAGGISLLVFCCIGYFAYLVDNNAVLFLSLALAGAIFGFLRYNTHPASLFMGDTGSQLLGFSAIVLAIKITQENIPLSPLLPLIILGFPILDTLTVMVERFRERRPLFSADKNHFHHRLMRLGLSHAESVFAIYVIQATMVVIAIFFRYYSDWVLMAFYAVFTVLIIGAFIIADRKGFQFKRYPLFDDGIKGKLRIIRDNNWIFRISFALAKIVVPLLLLVSCFFPARMPGYIWVIALCLGIVILAVRVVAKNQIGFCLRVALYMTVPLVLSLIWQERVSWLSPRLFTIYHALFGLIALAVLITVKHSRDKGGFRITTMDFLIIFIALVVPNLPDPAIQSYRLGLLAAEIIVLLFSYEVLLTELRGKLDFFTTYTLLLLALLGIRSYAGV